MLFQLYICRLKYNHAVMQSFVSNVFRSITLSLIVLLVSSSLFAQNSKNVNLNISVLNQDQIGISEVTVSLSNGKQQDLNLTDKNGKITFSVLPGAYILEFSHLGYVAYNEHIVIAENTNITRILQSSINQLQEVVITAQEGKGLSTKSIINRKAMEHIQPSSFSDLMELLPGGKSSTPNLTSTNRILIREYGQSGSQYNTGSLGTEFVIDGNVMNSNADLQTAIKQDQTIGNSGSSVASRRYTSDSGVDMRTISTNDIESVEIIRGIPTVSYGDLTSGLVLINRKSGKTKWQGRVKADGFSKMFYLAKGFEIDPTWDVNVSFDYLKALSDPRDVYENYQRISSSIRSVKRIDFGSALFSWKSNLDFNGNLDNSKVDPDSGYKAIDRYSNKRNVFSFSNNFELKFLESKVWNSLKLTTNARYGVEDIKQTIFVQYSGPRAVSLATEQGVNDGYFPELSFVSNATTQGRPLDINTKLQANLGFSTYKLKHEVEVGIDFKYAYNFGRGQEYDLLKPPSQNSSTRPRAFNDIPAYQNIALFAGDAMKWNFITHQISVYGGVRISKMIGMDKSYALSDKVYVEPRFIGQWQLPKLRIGNKYVKTDLTLGYGELYKQPTTLMLYPSKTYNDFQQLNFHHVDPSLRYVNFMTFVDDFTNKELMAAKNVKKEIRLDIALDRHEFFITYFDENMPTGFRYLKNYTSYTYNRYDTTGIDIENITSKPSIDDLPYKEVTQRIEYTKNTNGSSTHKQGIEFGYSTPRFKEINTRFTLTGAWFKTTYTNSDPVYEKPNNSIGGQGNPYVGIYQNDYGYINSGMNYNLVVDTYLPALDMNISASLQGTVFSAKTRAKREAAPFAYTDFEGNVYPFLESDRTDIYKQWLVRSVSLTDNMADHYNFDMRVNLKVTKRIYQSLRASLFVNKLFTHYSPYTFNGVKVKQVNVTEPYFGMELTYNF